MDRRLVAAALAALSLLVPATAHASATQFSIMQDDNRVVYRDDATRDATMTQMKAMGVDVVRATVLWRSVAGQLTRKEARRRNLTRPRSYGTRVWNRYDGIVRMAQALGMQVDFSLTGPAPDWAHGRGPKHERAVVRQAWRPNATQYARFVKAVSRRYDGTYKDEDTGHTVLPRVSFWELWNEPNQAGWLAPQYAFSRVLHRTIPAAPEMYRRLYFAGRRALDSTGHGGDLILLGNTAPLGSSAQGRRSPIRPKKFLRELFCVDSAGRRMHGRSAAARGCSDFSKYGPLRATAYGHHPYTKDLPPTKRDRSRDSVTMANLGDLPVFLDRVAAKTQRVSANLPIVSTEFGYETNPPDRFSGQPLDKQAEYLNEGDYEAYVNPRVIGQTQFQLYDVGPVKSHKKGTKAYWFTYQSGLLFAGGKPKPSAQAYMLPFIANAANGGLGVWGQLRFRPNGLTTDQVTVERQADDGSWQAVGDPLTVDNPLGFFQGTVPFPGPGSYRAHWAGGESPFDATSRVVKVG